MKYQVADGFFVFPTVFKGLVINHSGLVLYFDYLHHEIYIFSFIFFRSRRCIEELVYVSTLIRYLLLLCFYLYSVAWSVPTSQCSMYRSSYRAMVYENKKGDRHSVIKYV